MATQEHVNALIARLAAAPDTLRSLADGHDEAELAASRDNEWSAAEVLAHLRASDDIMAYRAYTILVRDNPPLPAYDERGWVEIAGYDKGPESARSSVGG